MGLGRCPKCDAVVENPVKEWDYSRFHVKMYQCGCGKRFREYLYEGQVKFVL